MTAGQVRVLMIGSPGDVAWPYVVRGAQYYGKQRGNFDLILMDRNEDASAELPDLTPDSAGIRPLAAVVDVTNPELRAPLVDALVRAGLATVTVGNPTNVRGVFAHINIHYTGAAELINDHLASLLGEKRSFVLLHNKGANSGATRVYKRFAAMSDSRFGITQLAEANTSTRNVPDEQAIRDMLATFPNAGLIVSLDSACWLEMPPEHVADLPCKFATVGSVPVLWRYLRDGQAAALAGPIHGDVGLEAIRAVVQGLSAGADPGQVHTVQCELITPDKLADFARRYAEAVGGTVDERMPGVSTSQPYSQPSSQPASTASGG